MSRSDKENPLQIPSGNNGAVDPHPDSSLDDKPVDRADEPQTLVRQEIREVFADVENARVTVNKRDVSGSAYVRTIAKHKRLIIHGLVLIGAASVIAIVMGAILRPEATPEPVNSSTPQTVIDLIASVSSDGGVAVRTTGSPQNEAYNWLAIDENLGNYSDDRKIQRYSLATLFFGTDGLDWKDNGGWLYNDDECFWERLFCVDDTLVYSGLSENNLQLVLPPEIGLLTELAMLGLAENNLTGPIPTDIGRLTKLEGLFLWGNKLTGIIPIEISGLTTLKLLHLYENLLSGPIPSGITDLTNLEELWLEKNGLTGTIPDDIGTLTRLTTLWFHSNILTGTIPTSIYDLTNLNALLIYNNSFTGSFTCPDFIRDCLVSCNSSTDTSCRSL